MTCAPVQCNAKRTLYSHFTHLISALLISSHLFSHVIQVSSSQLFSSHPSTDQPFSSPQSSSQLIPAVLRARELLLSDRSLLQKKTFGAESFCTQKLETQMHLHREAFTKYFVLQSLHKALLPLLLCTTKLAQGTSLYYFVLQSLHNPVLLSTTKLAQFFFLALLCTTKLAQSTSQHYFYYKACTKRFPVLLCTAKLAQKQAFSTQKNKRFRAPASSPKQTPCNIRAAITMPFAAASTHSCSHYHYIAICIHALQNTKGEPITRQNERSATAAQTRYPSSPPACSHFTRKNTRFHAPASSPKQTPCNIRAAITMR